MRLRYAFPGLLCCLFGLIFVIATAANPLLTAHSTTSDGVPGAGFFPYLMGGICIFLGLVLAIRSVMHNDAGRTPEADAAKCAENQNRLLLCIGSIMVFLAFWKLSDQFVIGTLLLCVFLNRLFGKSWRFGIIYSVLFTTFVYLVFSLAFSIQFVA